MSHKRNILITGGLGYVGSRIAKDLSSVEGNRIILTTRRIPGQWPQLDFPGVEIIQLDLLDANAVAYALKEVDVVLHLSGPDEKSVVEAPLASVDGALKATCILLEASVNANVEQFIYFSTIHVYGSPLIGHISEETCPKPRHPYGILNRAAEDFVLRYRTITDLNAVVFRLSNAFGAPAHKDIFRWSLVVNDLCRMAVEKGFIQLHSDGSQMRDFIPLSEVSNAVLFFLGLPSTRTLDGLFNLGSGRSNSILQIANLVKSIAQQETGKEIPLHRGATQQLKKGNETLYFDITKLKTVGFVPCLDLEQGIRSTLQFCINHF